MWWQWLLTVLGGIVGGLALGIAGNWVEGAGPTLRDLARLAHRKPYAGRDKV